MMLRLLLSVLVLLMVHHASGQGSGINGLSCPPGQTSFCGCVRRCSDGNFDDIGCPGGACRMGCYCPFPTFLSRNGNCVSVSECLAENVLIVRPPGPVLPTPGVSEGARPSLVCSGNRIPTECATCEIFCIQRDNPPPCPLPCRVDCFCPPGFVVNDTGHCIRPELCPVDPPPIITVPPTLPPIITTPIPVPSIRDPFVVGVRDCTANEVQSNCVRCERSCDNRLVNPACIKTEPCRVGCGCRDGLLRYGDDCVFVNDCPLPGVDELTFCGRQCPRGQFCRRRGAVYICAE